MTRCESLFIECWRSGIQLSVNGGKLHLETSSPPSDHLLKELKEHKPEMLRFLSTWIDTPYGQAKFWGFLDSRRCGVVLRNQPDRVTWIKRSELMVKPCVEDAQAVLQ